MIELLIDPETFRTLVQFKNSKCAIGLKPMLVFSSPLFETQTESRYTQLKSMFIDFFGGGQPDGIDAEGLQYMISISAGEPTETETDPQINFRTYLIKTTRSGQKLPRVDLEEMGPRIDFRIGRVKEAEIDMMKEAMKRSRTTEVCFTIDLYMSGDANARFQGTSQEEYCDRSGW
jgi:ribosome production factor 2